MKANQTLKTIVFFILIQLLSSFNAIPVAGKSIYAPSWYGDLNNTSNQWCYDRSEQSDNWIVFWEAGYGSDPSTLADASYRVNIDALLSIAETSYVLYRDSLKFITLGDSKTDTYKMIILLYYSTEWTASGSGVDNMIGALNLSASAAQASGSTVAHEAGHCFQYQVHCDGFPGGWMYGFGASGSGGNVYWENCAQWQAFKVLPSQQFTDWNFNVYLSNCHKHILHETPRYANYFLQDYWTYLHGMDFIGYLWQYSNASTYEDPVEAYKRLTGINQTAFNNEMYDFAARTVTWDIPAIEDYGASKIGATAACTMNAAIGNNWLIDSSKCIENYGYNAMRLNVPDSDTVKVYFEGMMDADGYRSINKIYAAWRYGLVALLNDGTRTYSSIKSPAYRFGKNPKDTLAFACPENCSKLWLVVTGAPITHWKHPWDDNASNDEQWPYKVKFANTNLYGQTNLLENDLVFTCDLKIKPETSETLPYESTRIIPNWGSICKAFILQVSEIKAKFGTTIKYCAINPSGTRDYNSTLNTSGHWFDDNAYTTTSGNNSYLFSEFKMNDYSFYIGQYPNACKEGDTFTIRQALVYTPTAGDSVTFTFVFNVKVTEYTDNKEYQYVPIQIKNSMVYDYLYLTVPCNNVIVRNMSGQVVASGNNTDKVYLGDLQIGIYLVTVNGSTSKICITKNK